MSIHKEDNGNSTEYDFIIFHVFEPTTKFSKHGVLNLKYDKS